MKKNRTLGRKILSAMVILVIVMLLVAGLVFAIAMGRLSKSLAGSNTTLSETVEKKAAGYMTDQSQNQLLEIAAEKADIADAMFSEFERGVQAAATVAEQIYSHPDLYGQREVALPDAANDGVLTAQVLYSEQADPADPAIGEERKLIGNVQDTLMAINGSHEEMASIYVATESGITVQADYISAKKFDENGRLLPLEAKVRPWYQGAAETGAAFFTPVTKDLHTDRLAIMCGIPVYRDGELAAVAGAGMYLDEMDGLVHSIKLGSLANACIINGSGQVLFSTYRSGTLAAVSDAADLRLSKNAELAALAEDAVNGGSGVSVLSVDGVANYAGYAPMKTVNWSLVVFLSKEAVESPKNRLVASISQMMDEGYKDVTTHIRNASYMLIGVLVLAVVLALLVSVVLSRNIVKPIRQLTDEVESIKGDKLDFKLQLHTGDEIQVLSDAFLSLSERIKKYISDIASITAERERISTELSLATRIQEAMLPSIFPPFPNSPEFDLYATMDPAREVGGDFYDFFLIDDGHLGVVMADVSGKGIPAALFMMVSKIILQNTAMLGKSPAQILALTNEAICSNNPEEMFVTAWVGVLELATGRLTAANAGHEYPAVMMPESGFSLYKDKHGFVLGGFPGTVYREYEIQLQPGSKLFLYTDGVPEANGGEDGKEMFGTDRMVEALNRHPDGTPKEVLQEVEKALAGFVKDRAQFDDLTMLCLEYKGK